MRLPAAWIGILIFAAVLAAAEFLLHRRPPLLAARMMLVAACGILLFRALPWPRIARWALRQHALRNAAFYFLFLSHFLRIFMEEIISLFHAWRLAAPRRWRAVWWRSLLHASASLFPRTLRRAERFYAALLVKGLAQ